MLLRKKDLAHTSSSPGKTQLINHYLINGNMHWVDLPGYGFAKVSKGQRSAWQKMIWQYIEERRQLLNLFVLVDSRHTPQELDLSFINRLGEKGIPFSIVFTKADKETQREVSKHVQQFKEALLEHWEALPSCLVTSSVKNLGRNALLTSIETMRERHPQIQAELLT